MPRLVVMTSLLASLLVADAAVWRGDHVTGDAKYRHLQDRDAKYRHLQDRDAKYRHLQDRDAKFRYAQDRHEKKKRNLGRLQHRAVDFNNLMDNLNEIKNLYEQQGTSELGEKAMKYLISCLLVEISPPETSYNATNTVFNEKFEASVDTNKHTTTMPNVKEEADEEENSNIGDDLNDSCPCALGDDQTSTSDLWERFFDEMVKILLHRRPSLSYSSCVSKCSVMPPMFADNKTKVDAWHFLCEKHCELHICCMQNTIAEGGDAVASSSTTEGDNSSASDGDVSSEALDEEGNSNIGDDENKGCKCDAAHDHTLRSDHLETYFDGLVKILLYQRPSLSFPNCVEKCNGLIPPDLMITGPPECEKLCERNICCEHNNTSSSDDSVSSSSTTDLCEHLSHIVAPSPSVQCVINCCRTESSEPLSVSIVHGCHSKCRDDPYSYNPVTSTTEVPISTRPNKDLCDDLPETAPLPWAQCVRDCCRAESTDIDESKPPSISIMHGCHTKCQYDPYSYLPTAAPAPTNHVDNIVGK